ncbi:MAG: hypothetical protein RR246_03190 [Clostridia bacterium]
MTIKSELPTFELIENWDEITSYKNFAGGDEILDEVYIARRRKKYIYLISKPKSAHNLFGAAFHGFIKNDGSGSKIVGFFGLSWFDYFVAAALLFVYGFVTVAIFQRDQFANGMTVLIIGCVIFFFVFFTFPKTKKKYMRLIKKSVISIKNSKNSY